MSSKMQAFGLVFALQKILHCFQYAHNMIHTDIVSRSLSVGKITGLHAKGLTTVGIKKFSHKHCKTGTAS